MSILFRKAFSGHTLSTVPHQYTIGLRQWSHGQRKSVAVTRTVLVMATSLEEARAKVTERFLNWEIITAWVNWPYVFKEPS